MLVKTRRWASEITMALDPETDLFGKWVDASIELAFLFDFARSIEALLREAATKPAVLRDPLPDELAVHAADRGELFSELYPPLVYEAFLTAVVSLLEGHFEMIAAPLGRCVGTSLALRDLTGSSVERFRVFCVKVANLDLASVPWDDLRGILEIRNCMFHNGGRLDDFGRRQTIESFVQRNGVPAIEDGHIRLTQATPEVLLRFSERFLETIYRLALARVREQEHLNA